MCSVNVFIFGEGNLVNGVFDDDDVNDNVMMMLIQSVSTEEDMCTLSVGDDINLRSF